MKRAAKLVAIGFLVAIMVSLTLTIAGAMAYNPGGIKGRVTVGTQTGLPLMVGTSSLSGPLIVQPALIGVPDNSSNWTFFTNGVMPYVGAANVTVNGAQAGSWQWQYATTFTDGSGNGNTATPSFPTTGTSGVTATVTNQEGVVDADTPSALDTSGWAVPWTSDAPDLFTEGNDSYGIAGLDVGAQVTNTANNLGQDATSWHYIFAFFFAGLGTVLTYGATHNTKMGRRGSLFLASIVGGGVLVFFVSQGTIQGLVLIPFGIIIIMLLLWRKSPNPVD